MLLILSVAVIGALSDSYIITHADNAKNRYNSATEQEMVELAVSQAFLDAKASGSKMTGEILKNALTEQFGEGGYEEFTEGTEGEQTIFEFKIKNGTYKRYKVFSSSKIATSSDDGKTWFGSDGVEVVNPDLLDPAPDLAVENGTEYEDDYYIYKYNYCYDMSFSKWKSNYYLKGWGAIVKDRTLESYPAMKSVIGGKPVKSADSTYYNCKNLLSPPKLPVHLTSLNSTFGRCAIMANAPKIPVGVTNMQATFIGCEELKIAPEIPDGVTNMIRTFSECLKLEKAPKLPDSVEDLTSCFYTCITLSSVSNIPSGVTKMRGTFVDCRLLKQVPTIPDSVTDLYCAFQLSGLEIPPNIPSGVTNLEGTFWGCNALTEAPDAIPNGVTNLNNTFYGCSLIEKAPDIPNSVTSMERTFYKCNKLKEIYSISSNVTNMRETFFGCSQLKTIPDLPGSIINMEKTFYDCEKLTGTVTIPSTVTNMTLCFAWTKLPITMKYYSTCEAAVNYSAPSNVTKEVITETPAPDDTV